MKKSLFISIGILLFSIVFIVIGYKTESHAQNNGSDWEGYYAGKLEIYKQELEWKLKRLRKEFDKEPYPFNMPIIVPDFSIDYSIRIVKPDPNFSYYMPLIRPEKDFGFNLLKVIPDSSEILDLSKLRFVEPDSLEVVLEREQGLKEEEEEEEKELTSGDLGRFKVPIEGK